MCILLSRCPPTAFFGLWDWVWVAACKVTVAADSAMFNQSRGPIVMIWAMDFVNTWRRTGTWGRWDVTLVWSAPRWCRQGQQFCNKWELRQIKMCFFKYVYKVLPDALMQKESSVKIWNTYARNLLKTKRPPCSNSSECCYLRSSLTKAKQRKCERESEGGERERDSLNTAFGVCVPKISAAKGFLINKDIFSKG